MSEVINQQAARFGGAWTVEKLRILERYLDAYTTALKAQPFRLVYIDAFAGSGQFETARSEPDARELIDGSARIAVKIDRKPFDRLIFVDKSRENCQELASLKQCHPGRDIRIEEGDANQYINSLDLDWREWRGVIFLDPFATQVDWTTIERIAGCNALDMWLLFPTAAIVRILPTSRRPEDIDPKWAEHLDRIYGGASWRQLYTESGQTHLFGIPEYGRDPGVDGLLRIYEGKLGDAFGPRFLEKTRTLHNSKNGRLFELLFCVGNEKGIPVASEIAGYILDKI